ncbi:MAG: hydrogenase maturation protease [Sedimentisphaerales bacterium]|nr:hydrogenase maturation protease [Sedimentisphaerales bacterium]
MATADVLLIGYGNPGRLDDGLGPALAEAIAALKPEGVTVEANYQLTVEDAEEAARHQVVIFADASVNGVEPFYFHKLEPAAATSFSTHRIDPENVLALATNMFGAEPAGYVLGIRGYEFNEFGEYLSPTAQHNLTLAVSFLKSVLRQRDFDKVASFTGTTDGGLTNPANADTIH